MLSRNAITAGVAVIIGASACATTVVETKAEPDSMIAMSDRTQSAVVTRVVASNPTVRIADQQGRPIAGVKVLFTASTMSTSIAVTSPDGVASQAWQLGPVAGTQSMTASVPGSRIPTITFTATALADVAARFEASSASLQAALVSSPVPLPPSVVVLDSFGNGKAGIEVTFEASDGSGSVVPATATTDASGHATVQQWTLGPYATDNTLTARAPNLAPVTFKARINAPFFATVVVTGARHTCAVSASGTTYCWGANEAGQINGSAYAWIPVPTRVVSPRPFVAFAGAATHTCAIDDNTPPQAYCWGASPFSAPAAGGAPAPIFAPGGLSMVTTGNGHNCGLTPAGEAHCWGDGMWGQLGDGTVLEHEAETPVAGKLRFTSLAAGAQHTCGLANSGQLFCWGLDDHNQLGFKADANCVVYEYYYPNTRVSCALSPQPVPNVPAFVAIAAGFGTCGLTEQGDVYCAGFAPAMVMVSRGIRFARLAPDGNCGLTTQGLAYCWAVAQTLLGDVRPVGDGLAFRAITASSGHQCGILSNNGAVVCWGNNQAGQLGNGTTAFGAVALPVATPGTP